MQHKQQPFLQLKQCIKTDLSDGIIAHDYSSRRIDAMLSERHNSIFHLLANSGNTSWRFQLMNFIMLFIFYL